MNSNFNLDERIKTLLKIWRNGSSKDLTKQEIFSLAQALLKLQRGLTGKRNLAGDGYMEDRNLLGAYLLYYWPVSYAQVSYAFFPAIKKFAEEKKDDSPIRILDLGSGPGPASTALCAMLNQELQDKKTNLEITLADSSPRAMELAKKIFTADFPKVKITSKKSNFEKEGLRDFKSSQKFDIIISSHALNELWSREENFIQKRQFFVKEAANILEKKGLLLLQEPALLITSRALIQIRDFLIQEGLQLLSPCPNLKNNTKCPALQNPNQTCHAEQSWKAPQNVAALAKAAGLDRISFKMTFFAFTNNSDLPQKEETLRVVSDAMLNKSGRIRFILCDGQNRFPLSAKSDNKHARDIGFFDMKRYDSIKISNPENRGDEHSLAWGIKEDTSINITNYR